MALKDLILGTPLEPVLRVLLNKPKYRFDNSANYWNSRYARGGNSGAGSYGRLAEFKAEIINHFVATRHISSVIEFGCGDGNQLSLADYPHYIGVDVSQKAVSLCIDKFSHDPTKQFFTSASYAGETADLALSLDVIYHLIEDDIYQHYMSALFHSAQRFVIVYSSNYDEERYHNVHVRHRKFTDWVAENAPSFRLIEQIPNRYPYQQADAQNTSLADFYFFEKMP